jgi:hypothetical protein
MTENDYILATTMQKLRTARAVLSEVSPFQSLAGSVDYAAAHTHINNMLVALDKRIGPLESEDD